MYMQSVRSSVHFGVPSTEHNIRRSSHGARFPTTEV